VRLTSIDTADSDDSSVQRRATAPLLVTLQSKHCRWLWRASRLKDTTNEQLYSGAQYLLAGTITELSSRTKVRW
jgi:curli biogenesis system outer membrane secretion channel CsgG